MPVQGSGVGDGVADREGTFRQRGHPAGGFSDKSRFNGVVQPFRQTAFRIENSGDRTDGGTVAVGIHAAHDGERGIAVDGCVSVEKRHDHDLQVVDCVDARHAAVGLVQFIQETVPVGVLSVPLKRGADRFGKAAVGRNFREADLNQRFRIRFGEGGADDGRREHFSVDAVFRMGPAGVAVGERGGQFRFAGHRIAPEVRPDCRADPLPVGIVEAAGEGGGGDAVARAAHTGAVKVVV